MKRLLLVAYHFPPDPSVGALRWARMIPILREHGWHVDVLTASGEPEQSDAEDQTPWAAADARLFRVPQPTLLAERVEHIAWSAFDSVRRVVRAAADTQREHGSTASAGATTSVSSSRDREARPQGEERWALGTPRGWARLFWTRLERARQRAWVRSAFEALDGRADPARYDAVVASTPPHWVQTPVGEWAAERGLPYVMDLRDPWANTEALLDPVATPLWRRLADVEEAGCVRRAASVLANTDAASRALAKRYPFAEERISVVRNGWDDASPPRRGVEESFTIVYAGTLYFDRSPKNLFRALALASDETEEGPPIGIEFMGRVENGSAADILALARAEGVENLVTVHPPGTREEARALMSRAAVLVSLPWSHTLAVPAKIYEYMTFPAWLLIFAGPHTAPGRMLAGTKAAVISPEDVSGASKMLRECYNLWRQGFVPSPLSASGRFSRREATEALVRALRGALA